MRFQIRPANRGLMLGMSLSLLVLSSLRLFFVGSGPAASQMDGHASNRVLSTPRLFGVAVVLRVSGRSLILRQGWRRRSMPTAHWRKSS